MDKKKLLAEVDWVTIAARNAGGAAELARAVGRDRATIYEWMEAGNIAHIDVLTVAKVARASGVGIAELTGIDDIPDLASHLQKLRQRAEQKPRKKSKPEVTDT